MIESSINKSQKKPMWDGNKQVLRRPNHNPKPFKQNRDWSNKSVSQKPKAKLVKIWVYSLILEEMRVFVLLVHEEIMIGAPHHWKNLICGNNN